jgi:hypothetical protein
MEQFACGSAVSYVAELIVLEHVRSHFLYDQHIFSLGSATTLSTLTCASGVNAIEIGVLPDVLRSEDSDMNIGECQDEL